MQPQSKRKLLIAVEGVILTWILWIGRGDGPGVVVAQEPRKTAERRSLILDRAPARIIENPYPVFSGIALNTDADEVIVANDNEVSPSILTYPAQFPPTDKIMEPRRRIAGHKTELGLPCGVAISPEFRELYTVSGDGQEINVFPLDASGDVPPSRMIEVPHAAGGVFLDVKHDELYMTTEHVNKISVFRRTAQGEEDPVRYIQGPSTGLADPRFIYVDSDTNEILVSNHGHWRRTQPGEGYATHGDGKLGRVRGSLSHAGVPEPLAPSTGRFMLPSITVHPRTANGDAKPLRTIQGPQTQMNIPLGVFRDPVSGQVIVASAGNDSVLFFEGNANGNVAPVRVLKGPATNLKGPTGILVDKKHNELWISSWDNHAINVYPRTAQGNVAPLRIIHSAPKGAPLATLGRPGAVAYDPKRKEVLVPN